MFMFTRDDTSFSVRLPFALSSCVKGRQWLKTGSPESIYTVPLLFCFCSLSISYPLETDSWSRCFICSSRGSSVKKCRLTFPKPPISTCPSTPLFICSAFGNSTRMTSPLALFLLWPEFKSRAHMRSSLHNFRFMGSSGLTLSHLTANEQSGCVLGPWFRKCTWERLRTAPQHKS